MPALNHEFLRRVVNELNGRSFSDGAEFPNGNIVSAVGKLDELLYVLPEMIREFAAKIDPRWTRCHKLAFTAQMPQQWNSHDPISGVQIRCTRYFDVIESEFLIRFDAAFS